MKFMSPIYMKRYEMALVKEMIHKRNLYKINVEFHGDVSFVPVKVYRIGNSSFESNFLRGYPQIDMDAIKCDYSYIYEESGDFKEKSNELVQYTTTYDTYTAIIRAPYLNTGDILLGSRRHCLRSEYHLKSHEKS